MLSRLETTESILHVKNCIYQKSKGLISKKKKNFARDHVSLFISLSLLLHDYNVKLDKLPN